MNRQNRMVTEYKTKLIRLDDVEVPFEAVNDRHTTYGSEYYAEIAERLINDISKEHTIILYLAAEGNVTGAEIVSIGTESMAIFSTHQVVRTAIMLNSHRIVHIHNHPQNSSATSSLQDKITHKNLKLKLRNYEIELFDSMVINDRGKWISISEENAKNSGTEGTAMMGSRETITPVIGIEKQGESFFKLGKAIFLVFITNKILSNDLSAFSGTKDMLEILLQCPSLLFIFFLFLWSVLAVFFISADIIVINLGKLKEIVTANTQSKNDAYKKNLVQEFRRECMLLLENELQKDNNLIKIEKVRMIAHLLESNDSMFYPDWYENRTIVAVERFIESLRHEIERVILEE
ncbi:JAB domain-containing protein [Enterococcus hulanensis]|uniref:JAB domain-containing protein n=1 Tax=Enterococcus hulanensis TaxID=2559929 RepID=UPI0010F79186|nr:JAB domain-containing protein [Enterococcus hulanensis]